MGPEILKSIFLSQVLRLSVTFSDKTKREWYTLISLAWRTLFGKSVHGGQRAVAAPLLMWKILGV